MEIARVLWAKSDPYHPLWCHMLDVAAVAGCLLPRFGGMSPFPDEWLMYVAALHDIGKADAEFQNKDSTQAERLRGLGVELPAEVHPFRHEARSMEWVFAHLQERWGWDRRPARLISQALCGHHGSFTSTAYDEQDYPDRRSIWPELRDSLNALVYDVLSPGELVLTKDSIPNASRTGVMLSGLIVLADWIASNTELYSCPDAGFQTDPQAYWESALSSASRSVTSLAMDSPATDTVDAPLTFSDVWPECRDLRPSQSALEATCLKGIPPGLAIIEAPMGEGKTEAAIYLAENWNRLAGRTGAYIALPTMATSNQMHGRYSDFITRQHPEIPLPRLVHGMAWLLDDISPGVPSNLCSENGEEERILSMEWFRNAKRALLAPEAVGTVDQALMAALNVKHGFLRLFGLASKVLILDEVHAYDEYMTTILKMLLEWCGALGIPVIMLSATLSGKQRSALASAYRRDAAIQSSGDAPYPLLTFVPLEGEISAVPVDTSESPTKQVNLQLHLGLLSDPSATARLAADQISAGGCACVLANTVKSAQEIFRELQTIAPEDTELFLFHARFRAERRMEIEREIVGRFGKAAGKDGNPPRPHRAILVATQVVEQSLDVDFDVMLSQLAPVDLLLQRCGRMHRHERGVRPTGDLPTLHVLLPDEGSFDFGSTGVVYDHEILLRTIVLLLDRDALTLPTDFRPLIEGCYSEVTEVKGIPADVLDTASRKRRSRQAEAIDKARVHLIPGPSDRVFRLAEGEKPVGEAEESDTASYFRASTRLESDTRSILPLSDPILLSTLRSSVPPGRAILKKLFMQKVDVPGWWLRDTVPAEGFETPFDGPAWLRGYTILPMKGNEWRGSVGQNEIDIIDSRHLGLILNRPASDH